MEVFKKTDGEKELIEIDLINAFKAKGGRIEKDVELPQGEPAVDRLLYTNGEYTYVFYWCDFVVQQFVGQGCTPEEEIGLGWSLDEYLGKEDTQHLECLIDDDCPKSYKEFIQDVLDGVYDD